MQLYEKKKKKYRFIYNGNALRCLTLTTRDIHVVYSTALAKNPPKNPSGNTNFKKRRLQCIEVPRLDN